MLRVRLLAVMTLALTAAADYLFWHHRVGWTLGLFLLLAAGMSLGMDVRVLKTRAGKGLTAYLLVTVTALMIAPGAGALLLGLPALALLRMTSVAGWTDRGLVWGMRWLRFGVTFCFQWLLDLSRPAVFGPVIKLRGGRLLLRWMLPVGLTLIFVVLFAIANPVWAHGISAFFTGIGEFLQNLTLPAPLRVIFWMVIAVAGWALFRMNIGTSRPEPDPAPDIETKLPHRLVSSLLHSELVGTQVVRCLILFNLVFLIQNGLDIEYLWAGLKLPDGMSYAQYAHRGAYPLIFTALLAGAMVLVCFAGNGDSRTWRQARKLVIAWLAQNVFLVVSAMLRLDQYIQIYSLTLLRTAALIWMLLIAIGLILITVRIGAGRSNRWLVHANLIVLIVTLTVSIFCPFRGWVAEYNVGHCREVAADHDANRVKLDVDYLDKLGTPALPALLRAADNPTAGFAPETRTRLRNLIARLSDRLQDHDWREWTWERHQLRKLLP